MKKQIACPVCEGRGYVLWVNSTEDSCSSGSKTCPHCEGTGLREATMTNADRIRAMTDEELATWMAECNAYREYADASQWLPWLKQPAEVDNEV